ncbi:hypothetical protein [Nocardia sp. NPDC003979]
MAMLRRIHETSGLTAGQVAAFSGLPRSTAYRFINKQNNSLPKNRNQVQAFLDACRVPERSAATILGMWDEIRINGGGRDKSHILIEVPPDADAESSPPSPTTTLHEPGDDEDPAVTLSALRPDGHPVPDAAEQVDAAPEEEVVGSFRSPSAPSGTEFYAIVQPKFGSTDRNTASLELRRVATKCGPLAMTLLAIYALAGAAWFSQNLSGGVIGFLATVTVAAVLLAIAGRTLYKSDSIRMTATKSIAAATSGIGVGLLSWVTVPIVPFAMFTGFIVFTMAPRWFDRSRWTKIASAPGIFAAIASLWCGAVLATTTAATGFALPGAVFLGALTTITATVELAAYSPDKKRPPPASTNPYLHIGSSDSLWQRRPE